MALTYVKILKSIQDKRVLFNPIACQIYVNLLSLMSEDCLVAFSQRKLSTTCRIPYQKFRTAFNLLMDAGYVVKSSSKPKQTLLQREKLTNRKSKRETFNKPKISDVEEYCNLKGYHFDPELFVSFYEAKGWMIGKNRMKSWKSACITWEKSWIEKHGNKFYYQIGGQTPRNNKGGNSSFTGIASAILHRTMSSQGK